jgi:tetratricopeptide (TPR) repeat protein
MLAFEKAEDLLFSFNKALANYFFSRNNSDKESISLFKKEIKQIYSLNQSHRFELIKNFILIQCQLFANIEPLDEDPLEDLIKRCEQIIHNYTNDKQLKYYKLVVDYFWLEYYFKINQLKKAEKYFEIINEQNNSWLLSNNYCLSFKFLLTKPQLLCRLNKTSKLKNKNEELYFDKYDFYTISTLKFSKAIINIYCGNTKESIDILSGLISDITLYYFFHFEIELKLTLAYLYIKQNKCEMADELLKSLSRKINDGKKADYQNALQFMKVLNLLMSKSKTTIAKNKIQEAIQQFNFLNSTEKNILSFLKLEIASIT